MSAVASHSVGFELEFYYDEIVFHDRVAYEQQLGVDWCGVAAVSIISQANEPSELHAQRVLAAELLRRQPIAPTDNGEQDDHHVSCAATMMELQKLFANCGVRVDRFPHNEFGSPNETWMCHSIASGHCLFLSYEPLLKRPGMIVNGLRVNNASVQNQLGHLLLVVGYAKVHGHATEFLVYDPAGSLHPAVHLRFCSHGCYVGELSRLQRYPTKSGTELVWSETVRAVMVNPPIRFANTDTEGVHV